MPKSEHSLGQFYVEAKLATPEQLSGRRCPLSGRPLAEEPGPSTMPRALKAIEDRNRLRFSSWVELSSQVRTQIVSQLRFPKRDGDRLFRCRIEMVSPTTGNKMDSSEIPELLVYAAEEYQAQGRFRELMGITSIREEVKILTLPCTEEEARSE